MARQWGLGPVFIYESLINARRWQVYAGRTVLVFSLLVAMMVAWLQLSGSTEFRSLAELARFGRVVFTAVMGTMLVLVLMVAPAAAAGAICQDKTRGTLTHLLLTDLSDSEIVLGKLAARLVTVLGIVACTLPVLALATLLGGIDPTALVGGSLVIVAVAILSVATALTFSVWASKAHEALMATYAVWAVWLLTLLACTEVFRGLPPGVLQWFHVSNPFWLLFAEFPRSSLGILGEALVFTAALLVVSALLATLSVCRIRSVTLRQASRAVTANRARRPSGPGLLESWLRRAGMPDPSLDGQPILWRENHRRQPSRWSHAIWRLYFILAAFFTVVAIVGRDTGPGINGFQTSIGLLLLSVVAATSLAEERDRGSLDVLMASPLSTREIVVGKWWGTFRAAPRLAILPGLLILGQSNLRREPLTGLIVAVLVSCLVLAYGAAITSLGLALATWVSRLVRAVALTVTAYLVATVVCPTILIATMRSGPSDTLSLWISPFFGAFLPTAWFAWRGPALNWQAMPIWIVLISGFALGLLRLTIASFDRCLGRVSEEPQSFRPEQGQRLEPKPAFVGE